MDASKKKLYIVFDQLPKRKDGGLVATYVNLVKELNDEFDIQLVSIFAAGENDIVEFDDLPIHNFSNFKINNRFFRAFQYIKQGKIRKFFHAVASGIWFFIYRPFAKLKSKKLLEGQRVISSSPAAAMFLSRKIRFIQEIHTYYEYFWGDNLIGNLQAKLMTPAALTLFRTKTDAEKASTHMNASYIYNCFDDSAIDVSGTAVKDGHSALFVGRLDELKNPMKLLDYAKTIHEREPEFKLDLYGTGNLQPALEERLSNLNLQGVVELRGFTSDKSVYSGYAFMMMSSRVEGLPLVIVEAMANSVPTITTYWGDSVEEVVQDGITGYIARTDEEYIEKALKLLNNTDACKSIGENARAEYERKFTLKKNKQCWIEILSNVYEESFY